MTSPAPPNPARRLGASTNQKTLAFWKPRPLLFSDSGRKTQKHICGEIRFLVAVATAELVPVFPAGLKYSLPCFVLSCQRTSGVCSLLKSSWPPSPSFSDPPREAFLFFLSRPRRFLLLTLKNPDWQSNYSRVTLLPLWHAVTSPPILWHEDTSIPILASFS